MISSTSKFKQYFAILLPSSLGIVFYVTLSLLGIALNQFESIKKYLQLPHDLEVTKLLAGTANHVLTSSIGESRTETLVVGGFWAIVGLIVYLFLRGLSRLFVEFDDDLGVRGYVWPRGTNRYAPLKAFAEQAAFRLVAFILLFVVVIGPLAAVLRGPVFGGFVGSNMVLRYIVWFIVSVLVWHLVAVLLRLIVLKARLFG